MKQYQRIKASCPDAVLFFRLGDFYEMFFEDAETGARELEITLTSRTTGAGGRVPMCGVPHHAADGYIARLVEKGYKVAICDQMEDPRQVKGLVRREVVRVVTPGTVLDPGVLPEKGNNYIVSVAHDAASGAFGLASLDYSTGEFRTRTFAGEGALQGLSDEISCLEPSEVVVQPVAGEVPEVGRLLDRLLGRPPHPFSDRSYRPNEAARVLLDHFGTGSLEPFGCAEEPLAAAAAGALLAYLRETGVGSLGHIRLLRTDTDGETMTLDAVTRRNLELVEPLRAWSSPGRARAVWAGAGRAGTLLGVLDHTVTSAGGRRLRSWILHPLAVREAILARQEAVGELAERHLVREDLRSALRRTYDLERLVARAAAGSAGPRDLLALRDSLAVVPSVRAALEDAASGLLREFGGRLDPVGELGGLVDRAIVDDPPVGTRDGGLIRAGYCEEVDALRSDAGAGKEWIAGMEASERERTGIKSLKIGYSRVFGYFIEVTRPNLDAVPKDYVRRQTLANAERFITPELKEREAAILRAEERLKELEYELFCQVRELAASEAARIQTTAGALSALDALLSLAEAARRYGYRRPEILQEPGLYITAGRHPVVERLEIGEEFVPNDCHLGGEAPAFAIITGPNMAGKSTYCRQVALIVLMAQVGSLVPAAAARIGLVDRIFTRIGSADELSAGRSTFLVEMGETANILNHATRRSLIILDEIGRGTSTYDGLSLAWSVVEHIARDIGALTLFATHYHELTELETTLPGVANYSISVRETGDNIVFLRKVARGAADRSYGIQVARLAGLPPGVVHRAREILHGLESTGARSEIAAARERQAERGGPAQMALFEAPPSEVEDEIADLDLMNLTPLEALTKLHELQERVRKGRG
jgi:DNA mismatch repair protein MutS